MISEICFMESSEKSKSKVLVTGSNGLLGQKLTDLFITRKDWDLVATGTGKNRHPLVDGYRYESMDVTDLAAMKAEDMSSVQVSSCLPDGLPFRNSVSGRRRPAAAGTKRR